MALSLGGLGAAALGAVLGWGMGSPAALLVQRLPSIALATVLAGASGVLLAQAPVATGAIAALAGVAAHTGCDALIKRRAKEDCG